MKQNLEPEIVVETSDLAKAMFDVQLRLLFWEEEPYDINLRRQAEVLGGLRPNIKYENTRTTLGIDSPNDNLMVQCPRHYGVLRTDCRFIFQCVTENYKLILNRDAYKLGDKISQIVFHKTIGALAYRGYITQTGSQSVMDFVFDQGVIVNKEIWLPFVRIVNSYNSRQALHFLLGYKIDSDNIKIIFEEMSINIKDSHSVEIGAVEEELMTQIKEKGLDDLIRLHTRFQEIMHTLANVKITKDEIFPLYCRLKGYKVSSSKDTLFKRQAEKKKIEEIAWSYFKNDNGYYFIKVISKFMTYSSSTNGSTNITSVHNDPITLGKWVMELISLNKSIKSFIGKQLFDFASNI